MSDFPVALVADENGRVREVPGWQAAARYGEAFRPLKPAELTRLPPGGYLMQLPGRNPLAYRSGKGSLHRLEGRAVAAFVPPGHLVTALAAFDAESGAPRLPLNTYTAVCWYRGDFYAAARRIDSDPRHLVCAVNRKELQQALEIWLKRFPHNRLIRHHAVNCVQRYSCPNAINLFLGRWEAPAAVSRRCNTSCLGCISHQEGSGTAAAQERLDFVPRVEEIVELALQHLGRASRPMLSFGQGCEGEPLLEAALLEESIKIIRRRSERGTLHLNTNGSLPGELERLIDAGLDSVRLTLPAAGESICLAYRNGQGPGPESIRECARLAHRRGVFVSLNLLTFPGVTDSPPEVEALENLLASGWVDMIQWRNLNIDPDWYLATLRQAGVVIHPEGEGLGRLSRRLARKFPRVRQGCFNPPVRRRN